MGLRCSTLLIIPLIVSACTVEREIQQTVDDISLTASGRITEVKARLDGAVTPVIDLVQEGRERIEAVREGVDRVKEGFDRVKEGVQDQ